MHLLQKEYSDRAGVVVNYRKPPKQMATSSVYSLALQRQMMSGSISAIGMLAPTLFYLLINN
ncbi:hypothetical protein [Scytonema sp. NUACC21]